METKATINAKIDSVIHVGPVKYGNGYYTVFAIMNLDNNKMYYYNTTSNTKSANMLIKYVNEPVIKMQATLTETADVRKINRIKIICDTNEKETA